MPGGLLQLTAQGAENDYIIGNPQITFFKTVFKRHTNFSIENIDVPFENSGDISDYEKTKFKIKISK